VSPNYSTKFFNYNQPYNKVKLIKYSTVIWSVDSEKLSRDKRQDLVKSVDLGMTPLLRVFLPGKSAG